MKIDWSFVFAVVVSVVLVCFLFWCIYKYSELTIKEPPPKGWKISNPDPNF